MAVADPAARERLVRAYVPAKQFFDFCQWIILATAFAGICVYFINRPVNAWQYGVCLTSALTVTAASFWHVFRSLHAYVTGLIDDLLDRFARGARPGKYALLATALIVDAAILYGFTHMLQIVAGNAIIELDIFNS